MKNKESVPTPSNKVKIFDFFNPSRRIKMRAFHIEAPAIIKPPKIAKNIKIKKTIPTMTIKITLL